MNDWLILTATLPTRPSGLRVRVWRALKATHAGTLREGVYLLPADASTAPLLLQLERTIAEAGATAHLLRVGAHDEAQHDAFRTLFDRSHAHAELQAAAREARTGVRKTAEADARRQLRQLEQRLQAIRESDFFPGPTAERSVAALATLRRDIERRFSPGEPTPAAETVEQLAIADFQNRRWATRKRPWVDRLATAWLIARFVDAAPRFLWLDSPRRCPKDALGYDFDGARFTHVDDRVSFEVLAHSFGLDADPAVARLGELVHAIDVGGIVADEAAGVEALVRGLQAIHADDDALLDAAMPFFDALHTAFGSPR